MVESTLIENINDVFKVIRTVNLSEDDIPSMLNAIKTDLLCVFTSKDRKTMWECYIPPCFVWDITSIEASKAVLVVLNSVKHLDTAYLWVFDTDDKEWLDELVDGLGLFNDEGLNLGHVVFQNGTMVFAQSKVDVEGYMQKLPMMFFGFKEEDEKEKEKDEMLTSVLTAQKESGCYFVLDGDTKYPHYFINKCDSFDSEKRFNSLWVYSIKNCK